MNTYSWFLLFLSHSIWLSLSWTPPLSEHLELVPTVPQSFYLTIFNLDPSLKWTPTVELLPIVPQSFHNDGCFPKMPALLIKLWLIIIITKCKYMYVCLHTFCTRFFFFFAPLGPLWLIIMRHFLKKKGGLLPACKMDT